MITCRATLDPAFVVAAVPSRLFGSFVEHMGRCVRTRESSNPGTRRPTQTGSDWMSWN